MAEVCFGEFFFPEKFVISEFTCREKSVFAHIRLCRFSVIQIEVVLSALIQGIQTLLWLD